MDAALETLLDGVIDYAGLFPPAALEMRAATKEFLVHLDGEEGLLVNRFVCPAAKLAEFASVLDLFSVESQFGVTVIGTSIDDVPEDLSLIQAFEKRQGEQVVVEGYEVRSSPHVAESLAKLRRMSAFDSYLEIPLGEQVSEALHLIADTESASAKVRTGGLKPEAFPASRDLAAFIRECLDLNVPFKMTAGLHHPIRHFNEQIGVKMHGFLNVLVATALADVHDLNVSEITEILDEEQPRSFEFAESTIGWRGHSAGLDVIDGMRTLFAGFGSCSVSEPMADLKQLGLW